MTTITHRHRRDDVIAAGTGWDDVAAGRDDVVCGGRGHDQLFGGQAATGCTARRTVTYAVKTTADVGGKLIGGPVTTAQRREASRLTLSGTERRRTLVCKHARDKRPNR
jgi:hypothetical protein